MLSIGVRHLAILGAAAWLLAGVSPAAGTSLYAWPPSVAQGETVGIYVSTDRTTFALDIIREGANPTTFATFDNLPGAVQSVPDRVWEVGCGWEPSLLIRIPESWPSGPYLARFAVRGETVPRSEAVFIVKEDDPGSTASILFQHSITTWQAYNAWGGKSLYGYNSTDTLRSAVVSFKRPYAGSHGQGQLGVFEMQFIRWLESEGYAVEYCTDLDTHADPDLQSHYPLFLSVGHDEYWSKEMRDNIESRIAAGKNVAFFGGNTCWWQIRISEGLDQIICYKDKSLDPLHGVDDSRVTVNWFADPVFRPENQLTGVSFRRGGYVNNGQWYPDSLGYGGYTAHRTDHWVFYGTGLAEGDEFGSEDTIVGYETDGAELSWEGIFPLVTGGDATPLSYEVLGTSEASRGYATMGIYRRGGTVFNAATTDWSHGLAGDPQGHPPDPVVQQITRNVLDRLLVEVPSVPDLGPARTVRVLVQNHPNPFRESTTISVDLPSREYARIRLFDVNGRNLGTLHDGLLPAGLSVFPWRARDGEGRPIPPGVYFYRLEAGPFSATRKILVID